MILSISYQFLFLYINTLDGIIKMKTKKGFKKGFVRGIMNFLKNEKKKKKPSIHKRFKNLPEEEKQRLTEYGKNYSKMCKKQARQLFF